MKNSPKLLSAFAFISIVLFILAILAWRTRPATPAPGKEEPQRVGQSAMLVQQPQPPAPKRAKADVRKPTVTTPRRVPEIERERKEREVRPDHPDEAQRWRMLQMVDENGLIPDNALTRAWEEARQIPVDPAMWPREQPGEMIRTPDDDGDRDPNIAGIQPSGWTWLGPGNIGGRIRSILIHPTNSQIMWVGSVSGGIWKTTNGGTSWAPLNDFMGSLSVATMVMSPSDPNTIYAGTGEGLFTFNIVKDSLRGAGVFKTTDGGTTWTQLSSTSNPDWFQVARLAINPANSQILLAATATGIWRSTDGGATWTKRNTALTVDINFHPTDGTKCVASGFNGVRYSTDGGQTWNSATGLPAFGRVEIAYAKSNPSIVYASVDNNGGEIYVSTNGGQTFSLRNSGQNYFNVTAISAGQGAYDNIIWVDPTNSNILIVGGIDLWRSTDGGTHLTQISQWQSVPFSAHADQHTIIESPQFNGSTNKTVFFGNDGGIYRATDVYNVSLTDGWTELNNNLGITQFYSGAGTPANGRIVGGTQDNGTLRYTGNTETWDSPFGGDGGYSAADLTNSNFLYGEYVYLNIHRSSTGGVGQSEYISGQIGNNTWKNAPFVIPDAESGNALFISPFVLDPNNSSRILAGGASLWRTNDAKTTNTFTTGPSWASIFGPTGNLISAIAIAKGNSNIVWIGYTNGDVYFTTNGTATLPTWTRVDSNSPGLPNRYCTRIIIDPVNTNRVYVTFGGFSPDNVWRTENSGSSWTNITANLPSAPVRSLAVWQQNTNNLYVGTEVGVFASANGGQSWSASNDGPTNCPVDELFWMNDTLVAATYGRGMFSINITGGGCTYGLSSTSQNFGSAGGSGSFTVTTAASCAWSAVSSVPWITTTSSGSGNGTVNYTVAANTGSARTGTITVGGQTFTVSQGAPSGCPAASISFGQTISGSLTTSDCIFTGTTRYVDVYEFSGTAGQQVAILMNSTAVDTYLYLVTLDNTLVGEDDDGGDGVNSRIPADAGFITLPATGTYRIYATSFSFDGVTGSTGAYNLTLLTSNCSFTLAPASQIFIASASTGSFSVSTTSACSWTAHSNVDWLTTSSSGLGSGTVNFSVAANTGNTRTGTISVAGETVTIFQSAGNGNGCPATTITPGQTISANLNTDCMFTGTSRWVDLFDFSGTAGQQIVVTMTSTTFDTYLFLDGPNGQTVAQNDDGGGGTNSRIPPNLGSFTLPTTGTYRIFATSYSPDGSTGSTGPYSLTLLNQTSISSSVQLSASSFSGSEGSGSITITVTRTGDTAGSASVDFRTSDIAGLQNCTLANGRGSERCDYVTSLGTVRFAAGELSKTISIPIINDVLVEGNETFTITLSNAIGATLGTQAAATVTIIDNDSVAPASNPIDGVDFFIRQQYLDILNRQPDATGLQNWINTLAPCPNGGFGEPPASNCDRLHVAAGFFQSDEFLNRGYWAFRFYMVSYNQRPTYAQFIPDMALVGGPKSPAEEEASKVVFADAFVQRPEFTARYGTLTGQALANAVLQTAGLPSSTFTVTAGMTKGQILRGIIETTAVGNRFLTEGTVSIQYFGFLRRDPDTIGYQNNVNTLNANPSNLRHMIFIFIYSSEYRSRFGPP